MKSTAYRRATIVGLFLFFGLVILVAGIMVVGNLHNSFANKFTVTTIFDEVNGLQPGNNVWFSGVKIGTVSDLSFYGESDVKVSLKLDLEAQPYIRKNAKAMISTDGFIGNKIVVIFGGNDSTACVEDGDQLGFEKAISTEEMMVTLQENNKNILAITNDFKVISSKLKNGEGTLGKLLNDESLYSSVSLTIESLRKASVKAENLTGDIANYTSQLEDPGSLTNTLVNDTIIAQSIQATVMELQRISLSAVQLTEQLKKAGSGLNSESSTAGILLHDESVASDLKSAIKNLESSSQKLNEDLEALQHNFLFRGYFKKNAKKDLKEIK